MTTSFMTKLHAGGSRLTCAFGGGGSDAVAELARLERLNFRGPFATGGLDADVVICCGFRRKAEDRAWQGLRCYCLLEARIPGSNWRRVLVCAVCVSLREVLAGLGRPDVILQVFNSPSFRDAPAQDMRWGVQLPCHGDLRDQGLALGLSTRQVAAPNMSLNHTTVV